jgi:hypothetical protein
MGLLAAATGSPVLLNPELIEEEAAFDRIRG